MDAGVRKGGNEAKDGRHRFPGRKVSGLIVLYSTVPAKNPNAATNRYRSQSGHTDRLLLCIRFSRFDHRHCPWSGRGIRVHSRGTAVVILAARYAGLLRGVSPNTRPGEFIPIIFLTTENLSTSCIGIMHKIRRFVPSNKLVINGGVAKVVPTDYGARKSFIHP